MYATSYEQIGANIQGELTKRGMSQQKLADSLSISKQVMSKIIRGAKAINVSELSRIATVLGTTTDSLLMVGEEKKPIQSLSFMGSINNDETERKVALLRSAIDEICLLEELADG